MTPPPSNLTPNPAPSLARVAAFALTAFALTALAATHPADAMDIEIDKARHNPGDAVWFTLDFGVAQPCRTL